MHNDPFLDSPIKSGNDYGHKMSFPDLIGESMRLTQLYEKSLELLRTGDVNKVHGDWRGASINLSFHAQLSAQSSSPKGH